MRLGIVLFVVCMVHSIGGATALAAGKSAVQKHTVWTLPLDHRGVLQVARGDVIEVPTTALPVIRENLDVEFRASKQGRGVELVGSVLPGREGTMERLFLFKAFGAGPATLKVELLNADKSVRTTWSYQVKVK